MILRLLSESNTARRQDSLIARPAGDHAAEVYVVLWEAESLKVKSAMASAMLRVDVRICCQIMASHLVCRLTPSS